LEHDKGETLTPVLTLASAKASGFTKRSFDEKTFRWELNNDEMACDKLAEGIRNFAAEPAIEVRE